MTDEIQALLELPLETLALLTGGYLSYRLAYTGRDKSHSTIDVIFISAAFAFVTRLGGLLSALVLEGSNWSSVLGVPCALAAAAFWRSLGQRWTSKLLRASRVSVSDREASAWDTMLVQEHHVAAAILVKKTDGAMLFCDDLHAFKHDPHGPCVLGADGSIAMYVTASRPNLDTDWVDHEIRTEDDAAVITYIPATLISEIRIWKNR